MTTCTATSFLPAERASASTIDAQHRLLRRSPLPWALLDSFRFPAVILNGQRQIVLANDRIAGWLQYPLSASIGLRPGEAIGCTVSATRGDCGTSPSCRACGAAQAVLGAQLTGSDDGALCSLAYLASGQVETRNLRAFTRPLRIGGQPFTLLAMREAATAPGRALLSQTFFHDVLAAARGLEELPSSLPETDRQELAQFARLARDLAHQLVDDLEDPRIVDAAEREELAAEPREVSVPSLLQRLRALFTHHGAADGKRLEVYSFGPAFARLDDGMVARVLSPLLRSSLATAMPGETVTARYVDGAFEVHGPAPIPGEMAAFVMQRGAVSGWAPWRGLFGARVITERVLRGSLTLDTDVERGTTFTVRL